MVTAGAHSMTWLGGEMKLKMLWWTWTCFLTLLYLLCCVVVLDLGAEGATLSTAPVLRVSPLYLLFSCEGDTRGAVLRHRQVYHGNIERVNNSLQGHSPLSATTSSPPDRGGGVPCRLRSGAVSLSLSLACWFYYYC